MATARAGTPVVVVPSNGALEETLVLVRLDQAQLSPVDRALIAGTLREPRNPVFGRFGSANVAAEAAKAVLAEFEAERDADNY